MKYFHHHRVFKIIWFNNFLLLSVAPHSYSLFPASGYSLQPPGVALFQKNLLLLIFQPQNCKLQGMVMSLRSTAQTPTTPAQWTTAQVRFVYFPVLTFFYCCILVSYLVASAKTQQISINRFIFMHITGIYDSRLYYIKEVKPVYLI